MNGCGPCKAFMPEFDLFNENVKKENLNYDIKKIESNDVKDEDNVDSFPTVKISIDGKKHDYDGPRTAKGLQDHVENLLKESKNQSGGNPFPPGTFMTPAVGMPVNPALAAMGQPPLLNPSVLASPTVVANQPLIGNPGLIGSPMGMMGNPGLVGTSMGLGMNGMNGMIGVGFDDECNKCRKYKKKYHKYKKIAARLLEKYNELKKD
jgi:thiol-disulfide isomerase/thioredoxin